VPTAPDNLPDDPVALKRIIAVMAQDVLTAQAEIARLQFQLAARCAKSGGWYALAGCLLRQDNDSAQGGAGRP